MTTGTARTGIPALPLEPPSSSPSGPPPFFSDLSSEIVAFRNSFFSSNPSRGSIEEAFAELRRFKKIIKDPRLQPVDACQLETEIAAAVPAIFECYFLSLQPPLESLCTLLEKDDSLLKNPKTVAMVLHSYIQKRRGKPVVEKRRELPVELLALRRLLETITVDESDQVEDGLDSVRREDPVELSAITRLLQTVRADELDQVEYGLDSAWSICSSLFDAFVKSSNGSHFDECIGFVNSMFTFFIVDRDPSGKSEVDRFSDFCAPLLKACIQHPVLPEAVANILHRIRVLKNGSSWVPFILGTNIISTKPKESRKSLDEVLLLAKGVFAITNDRAVKQEVYTAILQSYQAKLNAEQALSILKEMPDKIAGLALVAASSSIDIPALRGLCASLEPLEEERVVALLSAAETRRNSSERQPPPSLGPSSFFALFSHEIVAFKNKFLSLTPRGSEESGIGQGGSPDFLAGARGIAFGKTRSEDEKYGDKADAGQNRLFNHERYISRAD